MILELKANSLDDGPGIRTVVFFKGCPLSCLWCHNPESKRTEAEISFAANDCIDCGTCREICHQQALSKINPFYIDRSKCNLCFDCIDSCPSQALTRVGKTMSTDEITDLVLKDKPFYDVSGGGVTLSGGEPTMFADYCGELLRKIKSHNISTLVETCGQFKFETFERLILPYTDIIYYDLKIFPTDLHRKYCGANNEQILENFTRLQKLSLTGRFSIKPRTPLIPGITDTENNLKLIADFLKQLGVNRIQLMQFNPLWYEKEQKLGLTTQTVFKNQRWQDREKMACCENIFKEREIEV